VTGLNIDRRRISIVAMLLLTGACASGGSVSRLDVNSDVPVPVIDKLPLTAGVVFSAPMSDFVTKETPTRGSGYEISLGNTNRKIFENLLNSMFEEVVVLPNSIAGTTLTPPVDVTLIPNIDDFSMLTAAESGSKFFAVSMRHFLDVLRTDGSSAGRLEINSYGRSKAGIFKSAADEIDDATDAAFRDLAVTLLTELPNKIQQIGLVPVTQESGSNSPIVE